jgi:ATP-binding cassette, subfamily B, bacterial HlyB/CyaB
MRWFLPTIWRYRRPLGHVLAASLFVQIFALTTPLFFQVVVDKVLTHSGYETLFVLVGGLVAIGMFDVALQYLRTYALSHTTNRIDVELGQRLFAHLLRLPIAYFETRSTGQTVARVRELETIRNFLTGQALFSALDLVFVGILFAYSWSLTLIVLAGIPFYVVIGFSVRPPLRDLVKEKFNRGAASQQFLVETIVGVNTVKSAAVEPIMRAQWEEKLAAYVKTSFAAAMLGSGGQLAIQYISKLTTAALLLFGEGGNRRRAHRRPARRLQHDRLAGGPADFAPIADLAGFSAGADLDRASGRYPEHAARILVVGAPPAADAARRDRISPRRLPLSSGRA